MSIEEQNDIRKSMRTENLIRDAVKGGVLSVALWVIWGAYQGQNEDTKKRVEKLESNIEIMRSKVFECYDEKNNQITLSIQRIERFVLSKI